MKTYVNTMSEIKREHIVIDATDKTLGRLSVQIAKILMGKTKPIYEPNHDTGDFVTVINAAKVKITGKKTEQKLYYRHSNYPGGMKSISLGKMMEQFPTRAIEYAVTGMLPHTRLGAQMNKKLRVFAGPVTNKAARSVAVKPVKTDKPKAEKPKNIRPAVVKAPEKPGADKSKAAKPAEKSAVKK
jgi:large subunit ribosomal protein L13